MALALQSSLRVPAQAGAARRTRTLWYQRRGSVVTPFLSDGKLGSVEFQNDRVTKLELEVNSLKRVVVHGSKAPVLNAAATLAKATLHSVEVLQQKREGKAPASRKLMYASTAQAFQKMLPNLDASSKATLQDIGGTDAEAVCVMMDALLTARSAGVHPANLEQLTEAVADALGYVSPALRAQGPELAAACDLLDAYEDKIRPLVAAAQQ
ncbi:hypothetical protein HYH03_010659 [Edaphochlamys debaryana]|uniref:Uncharacterized protein n=1 Tax=Edaphochlamys debaryana TaxID=47281 RepID=A0A835XWN1_9CHLO|nr:hypothetical protein HYH03_010659 [Edaphochlamys debaryana]|eukprot:KAG2490987.1 hypothetical protein HYH03_010659 [Edaphochlamys debaryana]